MSKKALTCKVVSGVLRIEIGVETLKKAAENCESFWQPVTDKHALVVANPKMFAKDVRGELLAEDETGSNAIHRMLDAAFLSAADNGSEGLDYDAMEVLTDAEAAAQAE